MTLTSADVRAGFLITLLVNPSASLFILTCMKFRALFFLLIYSFHSVNTHVGRSFAQHSLALTNYSKPLTSRCAQMMAYKTVDGGPWTGCAVLFLRSLCPGVNLLSLFKDREQGKFVVFKVIKLTLTGESGSPCLAYQSSSKLPLS